MMEILWTVGAVAGIASALVVGIALWAFQEVWYEPLMVGIKQGRAEQRRDHERRNR